MENDGRINPVGCRERNPNELVHRAFRLSDRTMEKLDQIIRYARSNMDGRLVPFAVTRSAMLRALICDKCAEIEERRARSKNLMRRRQSKKPERRNTYPPNESEDTMDQLQARNYRRLLRYAREIQFAAEQLASETNPRDHVEMPMDYDWDTVGLCIERLKEWINLADAVCKSVKLELDGDGTPCEFGTVVAGVFCPKAQ